jgi:D-glycero-D-manno-heptose 1,7-bisphosphate phosphatase
MEKAIFLDKDGTLLEDVPYNVDPTRIKLMPGAVEGLQKFYQAGYRLVVISNQSGVAKGYFPEATLLGVRTKLEALLAEIGVSLSGFYYCPHFPGAKIAKYARDCICRKPAPGLILQAARSLKLDLSRSWFIGDILNDVEAGNRAGCRTVLLDNGHETEWLSGEYRQPFYVAANLAEAAALIVSSEAAGALGLTGPGGKRQTV